jgi:hypothetical protein
VPQGVGQRIESRLASEQGLLLLLGRGERDGETYRMLLLLRDFDEKDGWEGFRTCAHWLNWRTGIDLGAAREKVRVARALAELPRISAAMERGEASFSKVRALTRVATPETEDGLLDIARAGSTDHVERLVRALRRCQRLEELELEETNARHLQRSVRFHQEDGMLVLRARLDPEVGAILLRAAFQLKRLVERGAQSGAREGRGATIALARSDSSASSTTVPSSATASTAWARAGRNELRVIVIDALHFESEPVRDSSAQRVPFGFNAEWGDGRRFPVTCSGGLSQTQTSRGKEVSMSHRRFLSILALAAFAPLAPLLGQGGISVNGDQVLTGDVQCPAGQTLTGFLSNGTEVCACGPGLTQCTTACTDLRADPLNCGACDKECSAGTLCVDGRCRGCDVFTQDCATEGETCYFIPSIATSVCATAFGTGTQGDACEFINSCAEGYICFLPNDVENPTGPACARTCDADRTFPVTPNEFCSSEVGAGSRCVRAPDFYADIGDEASDIAFCVGAEWFPP